MKTKQILAVIKEVEDFKRRLDESCDPRYYETATEIFIMYPVAGCPELEVLFAEHDHMRDKEDINELSDRFNFDKVVGYSWDGSDINWL